MASEGNRVWEPTNSAARWSTLMPPSALVRERRVGSVAPMTGLPRGRAQELDAIVMKAIARERGARYGSAAELAEELRRFLAHRPVQALAPTGGYLLGKFLRRHRLGLSAAAAVVVALVGGLAADYGGAGFSWATRAEERTRLWQARHDAFWACRGLRPGAEARPTDVCVPISRLAECILETRADSPVLCHPAPPGATEA